MKNKVAIPKHSILMISYNQEKYIATAIESALNQNPMPFEIIISDDSSSDNTWRIIQKYEMKYPNIIRAKQNPNNLGIFKNINSILKIAKGDVISFLSGDDYFKPGLLSEMNDIIIKNDIELNNDSFIIVTNASMERPNGKKKNINNYNLKNMNIFKERLRYGIFYREIGISKNVFNKIEYARTDLGVHADWLFALDIESNCEKYYFTPFVSSVYQTGIGIVSKTKVQKMYADRLKAIEEIKTIYCAILDENDLKYLDYEKNLYSYLLNDDFFSYLRMLRSYACNLNNFSKNKPFYNISILLTLLPPKTRPLLQKVRSKLFDS